MTFATHLSAPKPPRVMLSAKAVVHLIPLVQLQSSLFRNCLRPKHRTESATEQLVVYIVCGPLGDTELQSRLGSQTCSLLDVWKQYWHTNSFSTVLLPPRNNSAFTVHTAVAV